jgi:hypothetical protein
MWREHPSFGQGQSSRIVGGMIFVLILIWFGPDIIQIVHWEVS